ncbi:quinon protein alcohol dehydrogenase-like superfamily [Rhypophila decipiens]|uniref:Quinon protein alcohol dehydrogenase-like superfamily n=1 Tax=Rhypophila decipiens TaxID=261697 RepID=A0AAN7B5D0_9PEZI|nr:quinon protein alcohol dehydrogenase-like superfamily [Rhypophila decipiens]
MGPPNTMAQSLSLAAALLFSLPTGLAAPEQAWLGYSGSNLNNRWASSNTLINSSTIAGASVHCRIPFPGGISVAPTVIGNTAYFPAWNGSITAVDYTTCRTKWQINVTALIESFGPPASPMQAALIAAVSRTTPQVDVKNKILYFATFRQALVFAANLDTGQILARIQIDTHHLAQITQSPSLHLPTNTLYLGVSSSEESTVSFDPNAGSSNSSEPYTFIGTAVAVRYSIPQKKFTILWTRKTLPEDDQRPGSPGRWSGAAIWGSQPAIDTSRNSVYYATGNVYSVPDAYLPCTADPTLCTIPDRVWQNSVIALDLNTGYPKWARHLGPLDSWTVACTIPPINPDLCIGSPGPDADFAIAPVYVPKSQQSQSPPGGKGKGKGNNPPEKIDDLLVIGQKNGEIHALYASTGQVKWSTKAGPGGQSGGIMWGISVDNSGRVYFNEANTASTSWKPGPLPSPGSPDTRPTVAGGAHSAVDLQTGKILWQIPTKENALASNPPTVVGDLVVMGWQDYRTFDAGGNMIFKGGLKFMKKGTGEVVKELDLGEYHLAGVSVQGRYLVFGTGHHVFFNGSLWVLKV